MKPLELAKNVAIGIGVTWVVGIMFAGLTLLTAMYIKVLTGFDLIKDWIKPFFEG